MSRRRKIYGRSGNAIVEVHDIRNEFFIDEKRVLAGSRFVQSASLLRLHIFFTVSVRAVFRTPSSNASGCDPSLTSTNVCPMSVST
jgi:hypothetical protein